MGKVLDDEQIILKDIAEDWYMQITNGERPKGSLSTMIQCEHTNQQLEVSTKKIGSGCTKCDQNICSLYFKYGNDD